MIGQGINPLSNLGDILLVRGGVDTVAAAAAAVAAYAWLVRSDLWTLLDAGATAALAGLAGWHAGCLVRDTCLGTRSSLPWALEQDPAGIGRHPVEIYAAIGLLSSRSQRCCGGRRPGGRRRGSSRPPRGPPLHSFG